MFIKLQRHVSFHCDNSSVTRTSSNPSKILPRAQKLRVHRSHCATRLPTSVGRFNKVLKTGRAVSLQTTACTRVRTRAVENAFPGKFRSVRARPGLVFATFLSIEGFRVGVRTGVKVRVPKSVRPAVKAVGPSPGKSRPVSRLRNKAVECRPCYPLGRETRDIFVTCITFGRRIVRVCYLLATATRYVAFSHVCFSSR